MYDKKFTKIMNYVFKDEAGFIDDPDDEGGRTNMGIRQDYYSIYRKKKNLPFKDVINLTKEEATQYYYEMYYKKSGADKQSDIRDAYILFDTAVLDGPESSQIMFKKSGENFYKMLDMKREHHKSVANNPKKPKQKKWLEGWLNRVDKVERRANELIEDPDFKPHYSDHQTPFDSDYKGGLKSPDISDPAKRKSAKNKYQYMLNKNGNATGFAADIDKPDTRTSSQKFSDEIRAKVFAMREAQNEKLKRIFRKPNSGKASGSGKGRWVTINGAHVYMED